MKFRYVAWTSSAILAGVVLASCNDSGETGAVPAVLKATPVADKRRATRTLPNGLRVTPIIERSDVAEVLEVKMWRMRVELPHPDQRLSCRLELRRKGKLIRSVETPGVGSTGNFPIEVLIGLHPLNDSWRKSDRVKTLAQVNGNSSSVIWNNPFKTGILTSGDATMQRDGTLLLMAVNQVTTGSSPGERENDIALVLNMKPLNAKSPQ